jgi:hypothetical protein
MKFTMRRGRVLTSTSGHSIRFEKDVPTHVPPSMYDEVLAAGGVPESEIPEEPKAPSAEPTDPAERKLLIVTAMEQLALRNGRDDFTAAGAPHLKALKTILGFGITNQERDLLWAEFQRKE